MRLKAYPDTRKTWVAAQDLLALAWVGGWALAGWLAWHAVAQAEVVGDSIQNAGVSLNGALGGVGSLFSGLASLPGLSGLAQSPVGQPGDALIAMGATVRQDIALVALGAGLVVALPPILYVLLSYVPHRWGRMKEMGSALVFVEGAAGRGQSEQARALLAYRALARLSFNELMAVSQDPIGDIQARRYGRLADAMLKEAGLEPGRLESKRLGAAGQLRLSGALETQSGGSSQKAG
jgi:hypothetical protein